MPKRVNDLTGQRFGSLVVIKYCGANKYNQSLWECKCDCNNIKVILGRTLLNGETKSCGCLRIKLNKERAEKRIKIQVGQKFGRLTVISRVDNNKYSNTQWLCRCNCGKEKVISGNSLSQGNAKSCGCLHLDLFSKRLKRFNTYDLTGEYGKGYDSKGNEFYFDLDDYDKIKDFYWSKAIWGYFATYNLKKYNNKLRVFLHRYIKDCPDDKIIDHINHDKKDNRKLNLRIATVQQNNMNQRIRSINTSGIKGVSWNKNANKWTARICVNYKNIYLGIFTDINDAIEARKNAEKIYQKEYAYDLKVDINFN